MKILSITFKNINSLAGENHIDFTEPQFTDNGIFAITGKTGAGKSSILDAISLALFGKTPRVEITGSENAVMTHGERDCYAEIVFEVSGKTWKSAWKQEKARPTAKNPEGSLKPVSRQIADSSNKIIADQVRTCDTKIVEILGLTFEQFTKVILLAQGSFAAFLQADKNDKGELLEQITGTEIYGEISKKIFERNRAEKDQLDKILVELAAIKMLSEDEIQNLNREISALESCKQLNDSELQNIEKARLWLKDLSDLQKQIGDAKQKLPELEEKSKTAKTTLEQSEMALKQAKEELEKSTFILLKVRELDTKIAEKQNLISPLAKSISALEETKQKLLQYIENQRIELEKSQKTLAQQQEWAAKNKKYEELVGNYAAIANESKQITDLQIGTEGKTLELKNAEDDLQKKNAALQAAQEKFATTNVDFTTKTTELEEKKMELSALLNRKQLSDYQTKKEDLTHLGTQIAKWIELEKMLAANHKEIENLTLTIATYKEKEAIFSQKISDDKKTLQIIENQIILLDENIKFAKIIQHLDEHRKNLKDGEACPLCGALEHPYALGNIPQFDEKEINLQKLKGDFQTLLKTIQQNEKTFAKLVSDKDNVLINKEKCEVMGSENIAKRSAIFTEISNLQPDFSAPDGENKIVSLERMEQQIQNERGLIDRMVSKATLCEKFIALLRDHEIPKLQQAKQEIEMAKNSAETAQKLSEQQLKTKQDLVNEMRERFQSENLKFLQKLENYDVTNIQALKKCLVAWNHNQSEITTQTLQITHLENAILLNHNDFVNKEQTLSEKRKEKGDIETEKQEFCRQRTELFGEKSVEEEENRLKKQLDNAENTQHRASVIQTEINTEFIKKQTIIVEKEKEFSEKQALKITDQTSEELQIAFDEKKAKSDEFSQKIGANRQALNANNENLKNSGNKLKDKEQQEFICRKWGILNELIGSADGKKYRNFAQALTFEHLIGLANRQLQKMSERYVLKRRDYGSNPFELSVIDKFQNAEERTAQNLSGGEKFIVSLSLALGLANMASKNMRIDTMFIDEGFGTLDADYLDMAISALSNLQNEGKQIGVISHLSELKERIATHIEVIPSGNGHSGIAMCC